MSVPPDQLMQIVGALMILIAFILAQLNVWSVSSFRYLSLNLVGGTLLAWLALLDQQWGFLLLEGAWAVASAVSLALKIPLASGGHTDV